MWHARRALRKLLETGAWDVVCVHSSWSQAIFGSTIIQSGIPLVRWLHAPEPGPWWLDAGARAARPALVLCNSYYTHDAAKTALGTLPAAVHYPPIRIPDSEQSDREAVRAEIGVTAETPVIAIAARMEPWKGHRLLLDGLRRLTDIPWQAWIIGGAQRPSERAYFDELVALAGQTDLRDRVQFLGQRTDVPSLLGAADLYCQPNEGPEPFGLQLRRSVVGGLAGGHDAIGCGTRDRRSELRRAGRTELTGGAGGRTPSVVDRPHRSPGDERRRACARGGVLRSLTFAAGSEAPP